MTNILIMKLVLNCIFLDKLELFIRINESTLQFNTGGVGKI